MVEFVAMIDCGYLWGVIMIIYELGGFLGSIFMVERKIYTGRIYLSWLICSIC